MRRLLSILLALALVLTCFSALADKSESEYEADAALVSTDYSGKTIILHSNDVHGAVSGYSYMVSLKNWFAEHGASRVILADAGDFSQGTTYVSASKGLSAIAMMNAAGYDVATLGNHELDFGYAQLTENIATADFPVICANVYLVGTEEPVLPPTVVFESNGVKIGFFGLETPETATKVNPGLIKMIDFSTFDQLYTSAQKAIDSIREDCDIVIGLCHLGVDEESAPNGYRSIDLYAHVTGVDFIIDGHSHTVMTAGENGEPIQSTGTKFANIGVIVIDEASKKIENNFLVSTAGLPTYMPVQKVAQSIIDEVDAEYGAAFATTEVLLNGERNPGNRTEQTNLGQLITDAMVWSVVKEGGIAQDEKTVVGITNGGGIRATIDVGEITKSDINTVLPFGNTVAVIYVTGEEMLEALEASTYATPDAIGGYPQTSGIEWELDTTKAFDPNDTVYIVNGKESSYYGPKSIQRVTIKSINGEPFDPAATYAVVTNNFCAAGGDTYAVFDRAYKAGSGFDTGIPLDEAVMSYVAEVLDGSITAEAYGEPSSLVTQIR